MKKIGLGLIGLGYIGKTHLRNCLRLQSAKLIAVADISKKALAFAKKMGIKNLYQDYRELLKNEKIDAVIIALPTYMHSICAQEAAEAGKHIFIEKPLARNVYEGKEIVAKARKNCVKLMVGYPFRFASPFRRLKQDLVNGSLGEIQTTHATFIDSGPFFHRSEGFIPRPVPKWWFKKEKIGGGALLDQGSHLINLLRWYFGEVIDAKGYLGYRFNLEIEDYAVCILKFRQDQLAIVNVGWYSMQGIIKIEFYGTMKHAMASHNPSPKLITAIQLLTGKITPKFDKPYVKELQYMVYCIKNDLTPSVSGQDGLKDLETIYKIYKSLNTNKR
jgi:predicted dehydrogenase